MINARFAKPVDKAIIDEVLRTGKAVIAEENTVRGGFGSAILELLAERGHKSATQIAHIAIPDCFADQGSQEQLRHDVGLTADNVYRKARGLLG